MKLLVTGHRGFIGQNLVKYIHEHTNWEVNGWDWGDSEYPTVDGHDWVIHLGAISSTTETDVDKILKQNLDFSQWLYNSCRLNYVNLQYASSASVYGIQSDFKESSPARPATPYAWSKYLFDRWVHQQDHAYGCQVQGFRYFNVYGNYEGHKTGQASPVSTFTKQAKETGKIKLFHDSVSYKRDFIAVEDVCRLHLEFIKNKVSGIWNFGTGNPTSFEDVAVAVRKRYPATLEYINMPDNLRSGYQRYTCADLNKLESTLGPQTFITVQDWLNG
jgi:ADP-L-glycero-D-manno-heptose 6-epimerase